MYTNLTYQNVSFTVATLSYQKTNMQKVLVSDNDLILYYFFPPSKHYLRQPFEVTFNRPLKVECNLLICMFGRKAIAKENKTDIENPLNPSRKTTITAQKNFLLPITCIMCRMIGLQFNRLCYSGEVTLLFVCFYLCVISLVFMK